ncbi:MAG: hypothetical protein R3E53_03550 [Myxococcota bacterium]
MRVAADATRRTRAGLICLLVVTGLACAPERGADSGGAVRGHFRDADTGEPIAGAMVFEVSTRGAGGADLLRIARLRTARTDADGRFDFPPSAAMPGLTPRYGPRYDAWHASYGLIRGREASEGTVELRASLRDAHLRQADAAALCAVRDRDELTRRIAELACPPARPDLLADRTPRARGALDAQGRRDGDWVFLREDGSVIAEGRYEAGAAIGTWRFHPPAARSAD